MSSARNEPHCHAGSQTDDTFPTMTPFDQLYDKICEQQLQLDTYAAQIATLNKELATIKVRLLVRSLLLLTGTLT